MTRFGGPPEGMITNAAYLVCDIELLGQSGNRSQVRHRELIYYSVYPLQRLKGRASWGFEPAVAGFPDQGERAIDIAPNVYQVVRDWQTVWVDHRTDGTHPGISTVLGGAYGSGGPGAPWNFFNEAEIFFPLPTIERRPTAPASIDCSVTLDAVTAVSAAATARGGAPVLQYELHVLWEDATTPSWAALPLTGAAPARVGTLVSNRKLGAPLKFRARARSEVGWGDWSAEVQYTVPELLGRRPVASGGEIAAQSAERYLGRINGVDTWAPVQIVERYSAAGWIRAGDSRFQNMFRNAQLFGEGSWVEVRRNAMLNPGFESGTTAYWGSNAGGTGVTLTAVAEESRSGGYSCKVVSEGLGNNRGINQAGLAALPVCPSGVATASAWVKFPAGTVFRTDMQERDPSGTFLNGEGRDWTGTGSWQRVSVTRTNIAAGNRVSFPIYVATGAVTFYVDDAMLEWSTRLGDFFDGSSPDRSVDIDMRTRWVGAAHTTESVMEGELATGVTAYAAKNVVIRSRRLVQGKPSVRVISGPGVGSAEATGARFNITDSTSTELTGVALVETTAELTRSMRFRYSLHNPFTTVTTEDVTGARTWEVRFTSGGITPGAQSMVISGWLGLLDDGMRPDFWVALPGLFPGDYRGVV